MRKKTGCFQQWLFNFLWFAYKTFILYFFLMMVLPLASKGGDGINWLIAFMILSFPLAIKAIYQLRKSKGSDSIET
jgi:hypothetical protein